jgi:hypothetical protein
VGVDRPAVGIGDHELELATGGARELVAALDGDVWVLHTELVEVLDDGLAKAWSPVGRRWLPALGWGR